MTGVRAATSAGVLLAGALAALGVGGTAADTVTFSARPAIVSHGQFVTAAGAVGPLRTDQLVAVQSKPCDQPTWRDVAETYTRADGSWAVDFRPGISGEYRAASAGVTSQPITLQQRPFVYFNLRRGTFSVAVQAQRGFWHRKVRVERFEAPRRAWLLVKRVLLTSQQSSIGDPFIYTGAEGFRLAVPKGTLLRARLPTDQARPCYAAGYSAAIRR